MYLVVPQNLEDSDHEWRKCARLNVQCPARIVIGNRQYAGYLHNISPAGARLRTITLIRRLGVVNLKLPDLSSMQCHLRWNDGYNAGVEFAIPLPQREFSNWVRARMQLRQINRLTPPLIANFTEPEEAIRNMVC